MGASLSKASLVAFEVLNEIYIGIASGVVGTAILANHGIHSNRIVSTLFVSSITLTSLIYVFSYNELATAAREKVVIITGCDSGLGFSIALHSAELGFSVLAGCYEDNSEGAKILSEFKGPGRILVFNVDITSRSSVEAAVNGATNFIQANNYELWAVINNAAVMIFGEFEWLTEELIEKHVAVNLMGTLRFTHAFCPLLRLYKGRLINVSSHCAKTTLPGLSVYGATKTAVKAFTSGLQIEMSKYGVQVIEFIPGSFMMQSNIIAKQTEYFYEMQSLFTSEQRRFYGKYFKRYNSYISKISVPTQCVKIDNHELYNNFNDAILSVTAKRLYTVEPMRYSFYHLLFKISPDRLRDYFIKKFMQMPDYESNNG